MKRKEFILVFLLCILVVASFFYKSLFKGFVPYPGDLLVSEYSPWKYYSFLGYNPGSYPNKAQYFDTLRQIYPWKTFSIDSLKNGSIPLWNPYNFSGSPLMANFQSSVFYPLNFLYFLIPQIIAWSILAAIQPLLAFLFTYFYARKIGISILGSYFASFSFAFSSFMSVWLEYNTIGHVILYLPLSLLSIENLLKQKTIFWSLVLIFSLVFSLLAGHIQIFAYLFLFVLIYVFIRAKKSLTFFGMLFIFSLGLSAIQIIPGIELIMQSARSPHLYEFITQKILIQFWQLVMLFVPDFFGNPATRNYMISDTYVGDVIYIGLVPLFFVVLSIARFKEFFVRFFVIATLVLFVLITLNPITWLIYKISIPFISSSASNLAVFILCFSLGILSGFGVDYWRKNNFSFGKFFRLFLPFFLIFGILWIVSWQKNLEISSRNLLYSTFILIATIILLLISIKSRAKYYVVILLLALNVFDLWRFFTKFNPFSPSEFAFPNVSILEFLKKESGFNRYLGYKAANIEANFATAYSIFSPDGYDPLYPKTYGEFVQSSKEGKIIKDFTVQTRSDAVLSFDHPKILDLLGVKYILDRDENASSEKTFPPQRFSLRYQESGWRVYENKKALPRTFLVSDYKVARTPQEFEKIFFREDFDPIKTIILEEEPSGLNLNDLKHLTSVEILDYTPNKIKISTKADGDHLLFLSDTYYPGWKAFVDGKEAKIYKANYAFRAIIVPSGKHEVNFSYDPESFKLGFYVSLLSIGSLIAYIIRKSK